MKKHISLALAAVLVAALLSACSATAASPAPTPSAQPASSAVESAPAESVAESPSVQLPAADDGSLEDAVNHIVSYEIDTAGGSLKTAQAACALLDWCAANPDYDTDAVTGQLSDWYSSLDEAGQQLFGLNIAAVIAQADSIIATPSEQVGLLSDAGVETDYSDYQGNFSGLRNALVNMIQTQEVDVSAQSEVPDTMVESAANSSAGATPLPGAVDASQALGNG